MAATSRNLIFLLFLPFFCPASQTFLVIWHHISASLRFLHQSAWWDTWFALSPPLALVKALINWPQLLSSKPITASSSSFLNFNFPLENFDVQSINLTLYSTGLKQIVRSRQEKSYCILVWKSIPKIFLLFNEFLENLMAYHFLLLQWHIFLKEKLWVHYYIYEYQVGFFFIGQGQDWGNVQAS